VKFESLISAVYNKDVRNVKARAEKVSKAESQFYFLHFRKDLRCYFPTNTKNDLVYASVTVSASRLLRVHTSYVQALCEIQGNVGGRL